MIERDGFPNMYENTSSNFKFDTIFQLSARFSIPITCYVSFIQKCSRSHRRRIFDIGIKLDFYYIALNQCANLFCILVVGFVSPFGAWYTSGERLSLNKFFRTIKTGIQYLSEDSMQTSIQGYFASKSVNSFNPF